jgi:hypothetical protein
MECVRVLCPNTGLIVASEDILQFSPAKDVKVVGALRLYHHEDAHTARRPNLLPTTDELDAIFNRHIEKMADVQLPGTTANGLHLHLENSAILIYGEDVEAGDATGEGGRYPTPSSEFRSGEILPDLPR